MHEAARLAESLRDLDVLVLGDALLDVYLEGSTQRISREAPVPIVALDERRDLLGGAANAAANAAALGARVRFVSAIGDDAEGAALRATLRAHGVGDEDLVVVAGRRTAAKHRLVAAGQILVRFDQGPREALDAAAERLLRERLEEAWAGVDVVVVSDYDEGLVGGPLLRALRTLQRRRPRLLVVDAHAPLRYCGVGATALKANWEEAAPLLRRVRARLDGDRVATLAERGERVLDLVGAPVVAVTLDRDGAVVLERDRIPYRTAGRDVESRATIGAGDTFTVAFALALGAGAGAPAAADLAATAAAVVLEQDRTAVCTSHDLVLALHGGDKVTADVEALLRALAARRARGERLVMTNGCFDLLHAGHIAHLREARALGDVLVVGLNGDESTRLLKGEGRPVNGVVERAEVLAAVAAVDHVIPFEGPTAVELIRLLRPDVYVKGGDHRREDLPEACVVEELGGEVRILPYRLTSSTSDTIARIRDGAADGRRPAAPLPSGR